MDLTVCVATFGDPLWADLAEQRAIPSAKALDVPVVHVHGDTLHESRNAALDWVGTEWVAHLDADDELEAGYVEAMETGTADVRAPAVRYVRPDGTAAWPYMPRVPGHSHECGGPCLPYGNWLVVGAVARTELLKRVGWDDWPMYEDWAMWLRCYQAGASFEAVPAAIYRAHVRPGSRNRDRSAEERLAVHRAIAAANGAPVP